MAKGEVNIQVTLIIKGDDPKAAEALALKKMGSVLNEWLVVDSGPPFPEGALLYWNARPKKSE